MTHARRPAFTAAPRASGFTLVELLVVIGIIILLVSILLPLVLRSRSQAGKIRTQADFQTISVALEAYKNSFDDYPRPDAANTGAAVLGKALVGRYGDGLTPANTVDTNDPVNYDPMRPYKPGDAVRYSNQLYVMIADPVGAPPPSAPNSDTARWVQFGATDGADGPGFRLRANAGQVHGPYIAQGKLNSQGSYLTDMNGGAILYFVARPTQPTLTVAPSGSSPGPYVDQSGGSLYNADHNFLAVKQYLPNPDTNEQVLNRIRIMLGDHNASGHIDNGEVPITQPFLLWSPGNDGIFGPVNYKPLTGNANAAENNRQVTKCDDVMNVQ
jgi:type II secretory pathway pseudopilin PulG